MTLYQQVAGDKRLKKDSFADVAEYEIGNMYMKGLGVEVDLRKAYDYFKRAASHNNRAAENALNNKNSATSSEDKEDYGKTANAVL